jgi:triphosphoribosyl-dephospho-CoA synthetase
LPPRELKTRTLAVPVSEDLYNRIQLHARTKDRSIASLVREIVLASEVVRDNPAAVLGVMAHDPAGERSRLTSRKVKEPETMPLQLETPRKRVPRR